MSFPILHSIVDFSFDLHYFLEEGIMKVIQLISKVWRANKLSKAYAWNRPQDL